MDGETKAQRSIWIYPKPHSQMNYAEETGGQKQEASLQLPVMLSSPPAHSIEGITKAERSQENNFKVDTKMAHREALGFHPLLLFLLSPALPEPISVRALVLLTTQLMLVQQGFSGIPFSS